MLGLFLLRTCQTWQMSRFKLLGQIIYSLDRLAQLIFFYDMWGQECCFFIKIKKKHKPPLCTPSQVTWSFHTYLKPKYPLSISQFRTQWNTISWSVHHQSFLSIGIERLQILSLICLILNYKSIWNHTKSISNIVSFLNTNSAL